MVKILICMLLIFISSGMVAGMSGKLSPSSSIPIFPWDMKKLSIPPSYTWQDPNGPIRSLIYEGPLYKGKPTKVFAYYATPGTLSQHPSKDHDLPAIILLHGGGGTAYKEWVELWAKRGYAAIAMDLQGGQPDGMDIPGTWKLETNHPNKAHLADGGPRNDANTFDNIDEPITDQWPYQAVSNVILAHSLLLSFKEVDKNKTAITGISWGGYLTCIVAGIDNRFKAAIPVYGSGYIYESSFRPTFDKMTAQQKDEWISLWEPSIYLDATEMPVFFVNGTNDATYWLESYARTYDLVKGKRNLRITPGMVHSHKCGWEPNEISIFVNQYLNNGVPLPFIKKPKTDNGMIKAKVVSKTKLVKAEICYTLDMLPHKERQWLSISAEISGNKIIAQALPVEARIWFITVTDERGAIVSSELIWPHGK